MTHAFTIPGKPIPKGRPRLGRHGTYTPARTAKYESRVVIAAKVAGVPMLDGPVWVSLAIWFEHAKSKHRVRKPLVESWHTQTADLDNIAKAVLDAANGICWRDDSQVCRLYAQKRFCAQGEEARVSVSYGRLVEQ